MEKGSNSTAEICYIIISWPVGMEYRIVSFSCRIASYRIYADIMLFCKNGMHRLDKGLSCTIV